MIPLPPLPQLPFPPSAHASHFRRLAWAFLLLLAALALAGALAALLAMPGMPPGMGMLPAARTAEAHSIHINSMSLTSSAGADNEYLAGDVITIEVTFSENVKTWSNNPYFHIQVGNNSRAVEAEAAPDGGNTDATIAFHYTVGAVDQDTDGITVPASARLRGDITHTNSDSTDHTVTGGYPLPSSLVAGWTNQAMHKVNANPTDYDTNDNNLIEVNSLAQLNAIRWDLVGDGVVSTSDAANYYAAFPRLYTDATIAFHYTNERL